MQNLSNDNMVILCKDGRDFQAVVSGDNSWAGVGGRNAESTNF